MAHALHWARAVLDGEFAALSRAGGTVLERMRLAAVLGKPGKG